KWVFVRLESGGPSLNQFLGGELTGQFERLSMDGLQFFARRSYRVESNWKVYIDNYLDGGYHVPHIHKGLSDILDYSRYRITNGPHFCLQSSPVVEGGGPRTGRAALYYWVYPNFMINWYEGVMDTNIVIPVGVESCDVVFDYYFPEPGNRA